MRSLLLVPMVLVVAMSGCRIFDGGCADCCPAGSPTTKALTVACRAVEADGGPAPGVNARCSGTDAGAVTDVTGAFSLTATQSTCGIAAGNVDCGSVHFSEPDGGALSVRLSATTETEIYSERLSGGACVLTVLR